LKTKKILALQGLIFLFSTIGWFILIGRVAETSDYSYKLLLFLLTVVVITSGIINFIIWAIRVLLRKKETKCGREMKNLFQKILEGLGFGGIAIAGWVGYVIYLLSTVVVGIVG